MSYLDGHRPRLRDCFNGGVVSALETHGVLELLQAHASHVLRALSLIEGSIDSAPVYPRLIVEAALRHDAAEVVFAHWTEHLSVPRGLDARLPVALRSVGDYGQGRAVR